MEMNPKSKLFTSNNRKSMRFGSSYYKTNLGR